MNALPGRPLPLPPPTDPAAPPARWKAGQRAAAWAAAGLLVAAVVTGGLAWRGPAAPPPKPPAPQLRRAPSVVGLGWIEPASTVLRLAAPGNPDAARIAALAVQEGERVAEGQVLATLDNAARQAAQVAQAQSQVDLRLLHLARQRADHAQLLAARTAVLARARAELRAAEADYDRQRALVATSVASRASYDRAVRDLAHAEASLREAEAALARSTTMLEGLPLDLALASAELRAAEADLAVAQAGLEQTRIRAPMAGTVLALKARAGERIGADGLLELGNTDRMRAVIEVYQTDIARVRHGQTVTLRADALDAAIAGSVERLGQAVRRQTVINADPATATDARVIEVHVALPPEESARVARLSRLQVTAVFAP